EQEDDGVGGSLGVVGRHPGCSLSDVGLIALAPHEMTRSGSHTGQVYYTQATPPVTPASLIRAARSRRCIPAGGIRHLPTSCLPDDGCRARHAMPLRPATQWFAGRARS